MGLLEQLLVYLGSQSPLPWSDSIEVITVDPESKKRLEGFTKQSDLRRFHAQILPRLAKAGTRVIVLDYYYASPSDHDSDFARSIQEARNQGSDVIVGVQNFQISDSKPIPDLIPALRETVSGWGIGENVLGFSVLGDVRKMRLVEFRENVPIRFLGL